MKFKRGFAKKSLERIITRTALTIGSLSLILGLSCQESKPFLTQPQNQQTLSQKPQKYFYSKLETQVYDYVDKFSRKIPEKFIKTANFYHDPELIIDESLEIKSGKGRLVFGYDNPETIAAGYGDKEEFELYDKTKNPNVLTNISFGRMLRENDEIIILNKRNVHIVYIKKDGQWRKGTCKGSYDNFDPECEERIKNNGEIIPQQQIQKYIDLSKRLEKTYFQKPVYNPEYLALIEN